MHADHHRTENRFGPADVAPGNAAPDSEPPRSAPSDSVVIDIAELHSHDLPGSAWIALNGEVYDVSRLAATHAFGDVFRGHFGTECGALCEASHLDADFVRLLQSPAFRTRHGICRVGRLAVAAAGSAVSDRASPYLARLRYRSSEDDFFWRELRFKVAEAIRDWGETTHYSPREAAVLVLYHLTIYLVLSWCAWIGGSIVAGGLLGFHMICTLTNISHMAAHHGFSRSRVIDFMAKHFFDLAGLSGLEWQIAHLTHHHQPHSVVDYQTNAYRYLGIRLHAGAPHYPWHRFQAYYFWIVIAAYLPFRFVATSIWMIANRRFARGASEIVVHFAWKAVLAAQIVHVFAVHGLATGAAVVAAYSTAFSLTAFILLFNNHAETHEPLGKTYDARQLDGLYSWAEIQVRTSGNWYPTNMLLEFIQFHYGYFNFHIEHHLFPTLKPRLLKRIAPIVRRTCEQHGLTYRSTSFGEVQCSLMRHLARLGQVA